MGLLVDINVYPNGLCSRYETDTGDICVTDTETLAIRQRSLAAGLPAGKPYCATRNPTSPSNMMYLAGGCNIRIDCSYCGGCERWPHSGRSPPPVYCSATAACDNTPGCYGFNMHYYPIQHAYLCTNPALERFEESLRRGEVIHHLKDAESLCGRSTPAIIKPQNKPKCHANTLG